ncbi:MAG: Rieske (2Fe-2S) protein [Planctomycetota bacterium]|jgi:nitrite reductase/ring-hydroxylating ferredoxin subunit
MARVRVAKVDEIAPGQGRSVRVGALQLGVFNVNGTFHAINDLCPHQYESLSGGELCGQVIVCPLHAWKFDVTTGGPPGGAFSFPRVESYPVTVEGDVVFVDTTPRPRTDPLPGKGGASTSGFGPCPSP